MIIIADCLSYILHVQPIYAGLMRLCPHCHLLHIMRALPFARQHPSYGDCLEVEGILSELLRAGLCATMFTVSSTLI